MKETGELREQNLCFLKISFRYYFQQANGKQRESYLIQMSWCEFSIIAAVHRAQCIEYISSHLIKEKMYSWSVQKGYHKDVALSSAERLIPHYSRIYYRSTGSIMELNKGNRQFKSHINQC